MESSITEIAERIIHLYTASQREGSEGKRVIIGIAGVPASGKSTLAYPLVDKINSFLSSTHPAPQTTAKNDDGTALTLPSAPQSSDIAICVGLDGWHYPLSALATFSDPKEALRRRGAAFTFDGESYAAFVASLTTDADKDIPFPTFSHTLKDPRPSPFPIRLSHRIVIIEGLYTLLDESPWKEAAAGFDERIWVEVGRDVARERLVKRCVKEGIEDNEEAAVARVDLSDMPNGEYIRTHLISPTITVESKEDLELVKLSSTAGGAPYRGGGET